MIKQKSSSRGLKILTVECPILKKKIEEDVCFEVSMISEEMCPTHFAPDEILKVQDFKHICLKCKNHRE